MFSKYRECAKSRQVLRFPVLVGKAECPCNSQSRDRKHRHRRKCAGVPIPAREKCRGQLRRGHQQHYNCISGIAVATPWAMPAVRCVDVAGDIGAGPERTASALENPCAKVDEEGAGDGERNGERRNSSEPRPWHDPVSLRHSRSGASRNFRQASESIPDETGPPQSAGRDGGHP